MPTRRIFLALGLLLAACSPLHGCVESMFSLADDSRLPSWFTLPVGYSRQDVTVKLTLYCCGPSSNDAVFELVDKHGKELSGVSGVSCWHPVMEQKRSKNGGFDPDSWPEYTYVRAKGQTEVLEFPRGPIFRISDDPMLVQGAREAKRCVQ